MNKIQVGLVGNPNCGKTTLFNYLTGTKQRVGNWPGVTVEKKTGSLHYQDKLIEVIDLPGIYSLSSSSLDEKVASDYILNNKPDLLINIVDASNLERNLYLTLQLLEMKIPVVIALNMMDVVKQKNIKIKVDILSKMLDCPVIPMTVSQNKGIEFLKDTILEFKEIKKKSKTDVFYPKELEYAIKKIIDHLNKNEIELSYNQRWFALKLLEDEYQNLSFQRNEDLFNLVKEHKYKIENTLGEECDIIIADSRYGFINSICKRILDKKNIIRKNATDVIDKIVLNRFFALPIFFIAMYLTFWLTISFGNCFIDFFEQISDIFFVSGLNLILTKFNFPIFIKTFLTHGIGSGLQTISTFIPPIFFIFFCLTFLEDSGYMSRVAFIMDRFMRKIGLPGKAFVPMLVGFGCTVPAIMATRTLENPKDRIMTIMMSPFMSCGARLPVYTLFAAIFFKNNSGNIVFALYLTGIFLAILTGLIFKKTILKTDDSIFIMELPPYHIPTLKSILIHTWERLKSFLIKAGKIIIFFVIILNLLNSIDIHGNIGEVNTQNTLLTKIGKTLTPLFYPMGIKKENWPATVGIFTGIFAKESVIGTLNTLYIQLDDIQNESDNEKNFSFFTKLKNATKSIFENINEISWPFEFLFDEKNKIEDKNNINKKIANSFEAKFNGKSGAFSYLLFILIYFPCVATLGAVYKETNFKWTLFLVTYLTCLAWIIATFFYQIVNFSSHPNYSMKIIFALISIIILFISVLKIVSNKNISKT